MTVTDVVSLYLNKLITRKEARQLVRAISSEYKVLLNDKIDTADLYSLDYVGVKR